MLEESYFHSLYEQNLFFGRYQDPGNVNEVTWEQVFDRVAVTVAPSTELALLWKRMMVEGDVIPSSPQLWNYGADRRFPRNGSSCFTGRMGDTLKDFRQADSDAEDVYVASGGFGLLLNDVRPRGTAIRHCSEGAMGSMCIGGPAQRVEGTTGYITGSGRARGALMLQLSAWHPDSIEFILSKRPTCLGWLDDWPTNAKAVLGSSIDEASHVVIDAFSSVYVFEKEWPLAEEVMNDMARRGASLAIGHLVYNEVLKLENGRLIPQVTDWNAGGIKREANRDWNLPLQNCNMSIRVPDALMRSVAEDRPWVLHWYSNDPPKGDEVPYTRTDAGEEGLRNYSDGSVFIVNDEMTDVERLDVQDLDEDTHYRYATIITTWEGLIANMMPNQNQWRDTDYARFYRKILSPAVGKYSGKIMARQIWDLINENAHNHADPGVVFEDTYERYQPVDSLVYGPRLSNPCSEYTNSAGGSCNLASVNLRACAEGCDDLFGMMDIKGAWWTEFGFENWRNVSSSGVFNRYLGEISIRARKAIEYIAHALEYNEAPVEYIEEMTRHHFRTVGIGMMGLAEALMKFHIRYDSEAAVNFAAASMSEIALTCWEGSFKLAADGMAKPKGWNPRKMIDIFSRRLQSAKRYGLPEHHLSRWRQLIARVARGEHATHTCVTSVAPTGSIAMIASWMMTRHTGGGAVKTVTGGLEPPFGWGVKRQDSSGHDEQYHDLWFTDEHNGKPWMITAGALSAEAHVRMQAAVCAFTCMSVSKTINLPNSATVNDVKDAYHLAWELGIPGTSLYRDNSKPMQVLSALECPSGECGVSIEPQDSPPELFSFETSVASTMINK